MRVYWVVIEDCNRIRGNFGRGCIAGKDMKNWDKDSLFWLVFKEGGVEGMGIEKVRRIKGSFI